MTAILNQKSEFIGSLLLTENKSNKLFNNFVEHFYKHTSMGYLLSIADQSSPEIMLKIAELAFETFKAQPLQNDFRISHHLFEESGLQVLFLHSFDKPFVVRSLNVWLSANKLDANEFVHSILKPQRSQDGNITSCLDGDVNELLIAVVLPILTTLPNKYKADLHALYPKLTLVVDDYLPMRQEVARVSSAMLGQPQEYVQQVGAFLKWLDSNNFAFLGMRKFGVSASLRHIEFADNPTQRLGTFKLDKTNECVEFSPQILKMEKTSDELYQNPMHIKKTNKRSDVYRGSRLDSIKVLDIDSKGSILGLVQIIGLFTSDFYKASPSDVPGLQSKAAKVYLHFGFEQHSHDGRILKNIIDSIPLDEFYYLPLDQLLGLVSRILNMYDRTAVFARCDAVAGSVSVLVYIPKYRYSENLRQELGNYLLNEFGGVLTSTHGHVGDASFARLIYIINSDNLKDEPIDIDRLEEKLWVASQTWQERFNYFCKRKNIPAAINFSDLYVNFTDPEVAAFDTSVILNWLKTNESIYFEVISKDNKGIIRVFQRSDPLTLGQIIPIFTNFQLHIQSEITFFADINSQKIWMHYYEISDLSELTLSQMTIDKLIEGLKAAWNKLIEVDPFNALTITCGLNFKEIVIFRAYSRFLKQLGCNYSQKALAECLVAYPAITQLLSEFFDAKFALHNGTNGQAEVLDKLREKITQSFGVIKRLDHDRIMRRFLNIMVFTVRTNAYQSGKFQPYPCVSFKVSSHFIIDIPKPAPLFEIFVYSTIMEGCHLRGGTIARGGIRWSDRPEDFRSEVLGLMKAQMVKNSVIVPVGSKGGFFVKNYSALQESGLSHQELKDVVVQAYQSFIGQLLTLTDNLITKQIVSPINVLKFDDDDPYLVVAADKGTATFSDIANKISQGAGFWLGDAFASGGSNGYDHKKLAITARGAWIAVRRHFWELGIDCQETTITVVGIGDMAGDVFGNAMLQSTQISLVAAFNHKHIFLDPNPDLAKSYRERQRLFDLVGSNWDDYNKSLISTGGGIFERSAKFIEISPEIAIMLHIDEPQLSPDELITKILIAQVDLLFFGGIGTFIKAQNESHTNVADRANDAVRVDARMIHAKIIGEGANLGLTQLGRVEYALRGGRINMDAIDNSAGVDCSDHEVNLKIMCQVLQEQKVLDAKARDEFLRSLADEVSELVLEDNWSQTLILALMQEESKLDSNSYNILIKNLEKYESLPLRREVEYIPTDEELQQRKHQNLGITRPELAILLAYSKIHLYQDLLHALKNTACFGETFYLQYFPKRFQNEYKTQLSYHPLKVEITATVLANLVINTMGPCFVGQMSEAFRADPLDVVRAFVEVFEQTGFGEKIQKFARLHSDITTTLSVLHRHARNISQCVMIRLSAPERLFSVKTKDVSKYVPFSVIFTYQVTHQGEVDLKLIEENYKKLGLAYLWDWAEVIRPATSWQNASWLLLQHDLIKVVAHLCQQTWGDEKFDSFHILYEQLKLHISSLTDSSQDLLLLDYIVRQLRTVE